MAQPDFAGIYQAYLACRRRKRGTPEAQRYEARLLDHLVESVEALRARRWRPGRSVSFIVRHPKAREIHAAPFQDRVIHHYLVPRLEAIYEPVFIHDVFSNRPGKGTHAAVLRLQTLMRRCQSDSPRPGLLLEGEGLADTCRFIDCRHSGMDAGIQPQGCEATASFGAELGHCGIGNLPSLALDSGIHAGMTPLQSQEPTPVREGPGRGANGWYLQLDVRNFFNSIDRSRLLNMLEKRIYRRIRGEEADLLFYLCRALLETDPTANVHFQGAPHERERVPPHKRLGAAGPNKGLPIGNLSSQFFANVYLNELDQYVKHVLRCRHYLRYVDDFILLHRDPEVLLGWKRDIEIFLEETLDLRVKPEYRLHPVANGADFLGYIVRPRYLLVRRRVVGHLREKLRRWEKKFVIVPACCATAIKLAVIPAGMPESSVQGRQAEVLIVPTLQRGNAVGDAPASRCKSGRWSGQGGIPTLERGNDDKGKAAAGVDILRLSLDPASRDALRACLASYLGHFGHARHFRLVQGMFREFPWLAQLFRAPLESAIPPRGPSGKKLGRDCKFRLLPWWQAPASADSLPAQWRHFRRAWPGVPIFLQAGRCAYLFDDDAEAFAQRFGLRLLAEPPWGFRAALALPLRAQGLWRQRLRRLGLPHVWVSEARRQRPGLKRRVLRTLTPSLSRKERGEDSLSLRERVRVRAIFILHHRRSPHDPTYRSFPGPVRDPRRRVRPGAILPARHPRNHPRVPVRRRCRQGHGAGHEDRPDVEALCRRPKRRQLRQRKCCHL